MSRRSRTIVRSARPLHASDFVRVPLALFALYQFVGIQNAALAAPKTAAAGTAQSVDLFAGMKNGDLGVKFIPKDDREAQLVIKNTTKQPLTVKLPDAFVGVPVLAQIGVGGGGRNRGGNGGGNRVQAVGGGGGGAGGGGFGGRGGGGFNIAPEATGKLKLPVVCLEHGKANPSSQVPYEIRPIESFTKDPKVQELLTLLGEGSLDQRAAQAAAWHFANGMSWEELARKRIHHLGGRPDEPYFSSADLVMSARIATEVERRASARPATSQIEESKDPYSAGTP